MSLDALQQVLVTNVQSVNQILVKVLLVKKEKLVLTETAYVMAYEIALAFVMGDTCHLAEVYHVVLPDITLMQRV